MCSGFPVGPMFFTARLGAFGKVGTFGFRRRSAARAFMHVPQYIGMRSRRFEHRPEMVIIPHQATLLAA